MVLNIPQLTAPLHGFAFWFDVEFSGPAISPDNNQTTSLLTDTHPVDGSQRKKRTNPNEALVLSTAPEDHPTHWQQVQYIYTYGFFLLPFSGSTSCTYIFEVVASVISSL